jgi:long-chain acyl-CoA synthetase
MSLAHLLIRQARRQPHGDAILHGERVHASHRQWAARSAGLAERLRAAGLQPGERVLLFAHNHPRYLEVLWGLWWAGLVAVPVNAKLHPREVEWIAAHCGARWAFVTADVADTPLAGVQQQVDLDSPAADALLAEAPDPFAVPVAERAPHDTAWLFYTSGTTGRPKGVMLTGRNLMTMGLGYHVDVDPVAPGDAIAYAAPISHGAGLYAIRT